MHSANLTALQVLVVVPDIADLSSSSSWLVAQLRALLTPHYVVQPIALETIGREKAWVNYCRLLVIPSAAELAVLRGWTYATRGMMERYVSGGGAYLGVGWALNVIDCGDNAALTEALGSGAFSSWKLQGLDQADLHLPLSSSALRRSLTAQQRGSAKALLSHAGQVLAAYDELDEGRMIILSDGLVDTLIARSGEETPKVLYDTLQRLGLSPPNRPRPAPSALSATTAISKSATESTSELDEKTISDRRWPGVDMALLSPTKPLPQIMLSRRRNASDAKVSHDLAPCHPASISPFHGERIAEQHVLQPDGSVLIRDANDTIRLVMASTGGDEIANIIASDRSTTAETDSRAEHKHIVLPGRAHSAWRSDWTPLFDFAGFWKALARERKKVGIVVSGPEAVEGGNERLGDAILYGEAVTSTQTMLDKNPLILHNLPTPLVSLASFQLSGRGRGTNQWLSPPGCLQFSLLMSLPGAFPPAKLVFVQYLMALACCEGLDDDGKLGVRIKWPNDIYAEAEGVGATASVQTGGREASPDGRPSRTRKGRAKLGGILVNTSFRDSQWRLVIGCGINILNDLPTISIAQLMDLQDARAERFPQRRASMEESLAKILVAFDGLWQRYVTARGFEPFLDEYLGRWLHADQEVTLTTVEPNIPLRIETITLDEGLLRCVRLDKGGARGTAFGLGQLSLDSTPEFVDLQPDGNSFDLMAGLIRKKT